MELRQLRYFIKSAELLNFTEAARTLFVSESTLSQQIKQLEIELDIKLFQRTRRRVSLTEAGEMFLPNARRTLADAEYSVQRLRDLQHLHAGQLKIGVTFSLSTLLTREIVAFSHTYPKVKIEVVYRTATTLIEMLKCHKVDFILSYEPVVEDDLIESQRLFDSTLAVIVHKHHPLAALKKIRLAQLNNYPLALPSIGLNARSILDSVLQFKHVELNPQIELNEVNILLQLAETKSFVTVLSNACVRDSSSLKAVPIMEQGFEMHAALLWVKDSYQKNSAQEFIRLIANNGNKADEQQ